MLDIETVELDFLISTDMLPSFRAQSSQAFRAYLQTVCVPAEQDMTTGE